MKLRILGSGTCLGPRVGEVARMPPLFALDVAPNGAAPQWILFECSEGARWRLPEAGIDATAVAHVAVSHPHPDHAALPQFIQGRACETVFRSSPGEDPSLAVYLPPAAAAAAPSLWRWHQPEDDGVATTRFRLDLVATPDGFAREILPGVTLRAFTVFHGRGRSPAVAFRVETREGTFAYSGDTGPCDGVVRAAADATLFLCEAATRVGQDLARTHGHLTPSQAARVAHAAGASRLLLTHYSGLDSDEVMLADAAAAGFAGDITIVRDGDTFGCPSSATVDQPAQ